MPEPKIAIVHDWFNTRVGGAERVAIALAKLFPEAPVYTLIYNRSKFQKILPAARVRTSFLQKIPRVILNHPKYLLPLIPQAVASFDFSEFDIVISSSFGFVKNVKTPKHTIHICYCHTPMRFVWDYRNKYLAEIGFGRLRARAINPLINSIKRWDISGSQGVDIWLANSKNVAKRIDRFYGKTAEVIYPPVEVGSYKQLRKVKKKNFFVTASALTPYKKVDVLIRAANRGGWQLKVLGDGPQKKSLQKLAGRNVEILGFVGERKKRQLFTQARAFMFAADEDFGIAPIEAMAAGTPVIALRKGGLAETVTYKTGILFDSATPEHVSRAVKKFNKSSFKTQDLYNHANKYSSAKFNSRIRKIITNVGEKNAHK